MAVSPTFRSEGSHQAFHKSQPADLSSVIKARIGHHSSRNDISTKNIRHEITKRQVCFAGFQGHKVTGTRKGDAREVGHAEKKGPFQRKLRHSMSFDL